MGVFPFLGSNYSISARQENVLTTSESLCGTLSWKYFSLKSLDHDSHLTSLQALEERSTRVGNSWYFPGGPVVRIPRFHCQAPGFDSWSVGELRSHMLRGAAETKTKSTCVLRLLKCWR